MVSKVREDGDRDEDDRELPAGNPDRGQNQPPGFWILTSSLAQPSETSRLLYEDPYQPHYGAVNPHPNVPQPDPEELRRERDALERLCAQTSEYAITFRLSYYEANPFVRSKLIDVTQPADAEESSKINNEYPRLFNQRFKLPPSSSLSSSPEPTTAIEESWLAATADKLEDWAQVKRMSIGEIVIRFDKGAVENTSVSNQ
ncbi:MAG: hypothetical protein Q9165_006517 [Trypethelium subeluteriae]